MTYLTTAFQFFVTPYLLLIFLYYQLRKVSLDEKGVDIASIGGDPRTEGEKV